MVSLAGGAMRLLIVLTLLTAFLPAAGSREAKWTVFGLGLSNAVLMFGDLVFSPALMVTHHAAYFFDGTIAIQITYLAAVLYLRFGNMITWLRWAYAVGAVALLINGAILSFAIYRNYLPSNQEIASFAKVLKSLKPSAGDLVIARARTVDDPCAWVPLLTRATVLHCRNSEVALTMEQRHTVYRVRQAFYLYFIGQNSQWLEEITANQKSTAMQGYLSVGGNRPQGIASIENEPVPLLSRVEGGDTEMHSFFHAFKRVLIIDSTEHPIFSQERLAVYLSLGEERKVGKFSVYWGRPI
jgi:hypothetical protein